MKPMLEDLWYSYFIERRGSMSYEEQEILNLVNKNGDNLKNTLNREQEELFEKYDDALADLNLFNEKNAFLKGVHFATMFLIEATQADM